MKNTTKTMIKTTTKTTIKTTVKAMTKIMIQTGCFLDNKDCIEDNNKGNDEDNDNYPTWS